MAASPRSTEMNDADDDAAGVVGPHTKHSSVHAPSGADRCLCTLPACTGSSKLTGRPPLAPIHRAVCQHSLPFGETNLTVSEPQRCNSRPYYHRHPSVEPQIVLQTHPLNPVINLEKDSKKLEPCSLRRLPGHLLVPLAAPHACCSLAVTYAGAGATALCHWGTLAGGIAHTGATYACGRDPCLGQL